MSTVERALRWPEIEVVAKATRRRFTLECKRKVVREADGCKTPGAVGALLRRGGLDSSHPAAWGGGGGGGGGAAGGQKNGPPRGGGWSGGKNGAGQSRGMSPRRRRGGRGRGP